MKCLQGLAELYREGVLPREVSMRPDLLQHVLQDRQSMAKDGFRLWLEPKNMQETSKPLENGMQLIRYSGKVRYAFEKSGQFYPDPSAQPFQDARDADDDGDFSFLLDASGMIIGWSDTLTGNTYGDLRGSGPASKPWIWIFMGLIVFIALILRLVR